MPQSSVLAFLYRGSCSIKARTRGDLWPHVLSSSEIGVHAQQPAQERFVEKPENWVYSSTLNYARGEHSILNVELLLMIWLVLGNAIPSEFFGDVEFEWACYS